MGNPNSNGLSTEMPNASELNIEALTTNVAKRHSLNKKSPIKIEFARGDVQYSVKSSSKDNHSILTSDADVIGVNNNDVIQTSGARSSPVDFKIPKSHTGRDRDIPIHQVPPSDRNCNRIL